MARFFHRTNRSPGNRLRRSWRRRALIAFNVVLALALVAGVSGAGYLKWRLGQVTRLPLPALNKEPGGSLAPMNVLLVGSDSRAALDPGESKAFGSSGVVGGQRSDTIMVLHIDPKTQRAAILSLPRDLWVPIAGTSGKQRINTSFQNGPNQLIQTIQQNFNIPIDHYAEVNFDTFKGVVSAIDGIQIPFAAPARDSLSGLNVPNAGCIKLTGDQALSYVRSRHYEAYEGGAWRPDPRSDFSRIDRQQDFIRRVMRKAVDKGTSNPFTFNSLIASGVKNLSLDWGFSLSDMKALASRFQSLDPNKVEMMTLPTTATTIGGADVLLPSQPGAGATVERFLHGDAPVSGQAPAAIPSGSISVRVLNGSGTPGQATETAGRLHDGGFVVSGLGDGRVGPTTIIRYAPGEKAKADVIASFITGGSQEVQDSTVRGVDAVITTGRSFQGITIGGRPTVPLSTSTTNPATLTTTAPSVFVPAGTASC